MIILFVISSLLLAFVTGQYFKIREEADNLRAKLDGLPRAQRRTINAKFPTQFSNN